MGFLCYDGSTRDVADVVELVLRLFIMACGRHNVGFNMCQRGLPMMANYKKICGGIWE